jgi:carbon monoxide dehydrogenase subunit G
MLLQFKIKKPIGTVFVYLSDMQKFVTAHPIIWKIDDKGNDNYLVHEKLKVGFLPISFTYPAIVKGNKQNNSINIKATVMKLTKVEMNFTLTAEGEYTHIKEETTFTSALPVQKTLEKIFTEQHTLLFQNIEKIGV